MSIIKKMRKQLAVYWAVGPIDEFGSKTFSEPVQIKCRWENKEGQVLNSIGEILPSMSTVYVDREMKIGDKLKLGELDSNTPSSPLEDREAFEIQGFASTPNLRAKEFLYTAYL
jgi:hypothetical protein